MREVFLSCKEFSSRFPGAESRMFWVLSLSFVVFVVGSSFSGGLFSVFVFNIFRV